MKWMLDTDTCVAIIKDKPPSVVKSLRGKSVGQVRISSITLGELAFGAAKSGRRSAAHAALAEFPLALEIASFDSDAATSYGQLHASLEKRGAPTGPLNALSGAQATASDLILVTHNTREFSRIDTLRLEDWTSS
jgi:tRNA(fMet)-specific endonuclease VapC